MSGSPLSGIRVLDVTRALAGPLCTMILGDLGADVIKVEMPGVGDETRHWTLPPYGRDMGPTMLAFNRNKRSIELDLHTEKDRKTCLELAATSDVFVENFRPGTVGNFGLDYSSLCAVRSDIVYCSVSGYGQTGPMAQRPALDLMVQAVSGLMSLTGESHGRSVKAAAPVADVMGGLSAAISILGALMQRARTGAGCYLDVSMLDAMIALQGQAVAGWGMKGDVTQRFGNGHPFIAPYESFSTADRQIVVAVTNDRAWGSLCRIPEFAGLLDEARFKSQPSRNVNREALVPILETIFTTRPAGYWLEALAAQGVPAELIHTIPEILQHPQIAERGMLMDIEYPAGSGNEIQIAGMPWRGVAATAGARLNPPGLGQHTEEILRDIQQSPSRSSIIPDADNNK